MLTDVGLGLVAPFRGLAFTLARPALWPWVALPVALMVFAILGVTWGVWTWTPGAFAAAFPPPGPGLLASLYWAAVAYVMLVLFVAGVVVAWAASTVLATPFYDVLAANVEAAVNDRPEPPLTLSLLLGDAARSIAHTFLASLLFGAGSFALLLVGFVPVVDLLVPFAELGLAALFVARELLDFPLSRRRLSFVEKLVFFRAHFWAFAGLGAVSTVLLCVPVLNFVSMPAAVVGATLLVVQLESAAGRASAASERPSVRT